MTPAQQMDPTWRYWKARALGARGQSAEARALLDVLAPEISFYGLLAAEETGVLPDPRSEPVLPTPANLAVCQGCHEGRYFLMLSCGALGATRIP